MKTMNAVFEQPRTVQASEIDELNHVNNLVYLKWFMEAALAHSAAVGWPISVLFKNKAGWVVRRHEIDYQFPAFEGEEVKIRTWISSVSRTSAIRQYEVIRRKDDRVLAKGMTVWVWISYETGRPEKIPEDVIAAFGRLDA